MKIILFGKRHTGLHKPLIPDATLLPETAIVRRGTPFFCPEWSHGWSLKLMGGIRVTKLGRHISEKFASRYWNEYILALHAVPRNTSEIDVMNPLVAGFDGSLMLSEPVVNGDEVEVVVSALNKSVNDAVTLRDGVGKISVNINETVINECVAQTSSFFTLHTGDLILTDTYDFILDTELETRVKLKRRGSELLNHKIK